MVFRLTRMSHYAIEVSLIVTFVVGLGLKSLAFWIVLATESVQSRLTGHELGWSKGFFLLLEWVGPRTPQITSSRQSPQLSKTHQYYTKIDTCLMMVKRLFGKISGEVSRFDFYFCAGLCSVWVFSCFRYHSGHSWATSTVEPPLGVHLMSILVVCLAVVSRLLCYSTWHLVLSEREFPPNKKT